MSIITNDAIGGYGEQGEVTGNTVEYTGTGTSLVQNIYGGEGFAGKVENNTVTINSGTVTGNAYGGYNINGTGNVGGEDNGNTVTITGGTVSGDAIGGYSRKSDATGNTVELKDGTTLSVGGNIYGGYASEDNGTGGSANKNKVTISAGTVGTVGGNKNVYGGLSAVDTASTNEVTITGGTINSSNIYGGNSQKGNDNNEVTITGGTINSEYIYGGYSCFAGLSHNNTVNFSGTNTAAKIIGGYSDSASGTATGNTVNITGGKVDSANGGKTEGSSRDNHVNITNGSIITNDAIGGYGEQGEVTGNTVEYTGTGNSLVQNIYGGEGFVGKVENNTVTINSGTVNTNAYGGYSNETGEVNKNKVYIKGGTVTGKAYGGYSESGDVGGVDSDDGNTVTITGGTVSGDAIGGYSKKSDATGNTVELKDGTTLSVGGTIYGGYADVDNGTGGSANKNKVTISAGTVSQNIYGGYSEIGTASTNTVTITGVPINSGYIYGGYSASGSISENNTVNFSGTTTGKIYGGYSNIESSTATGNTVNITGGTVGCATGGDSRGSAKDNHVNITNGSTITGTAYGGYGGKGEVTGNTIEYTGMGTSSVDFIFGGYKSDTGTGKVENNIVTINSGTVNKNVYGGYSSDGSGKINMNAVYIKGGNITNIAYGGYSEKGEVTGNTVEVSGNSTVGSIFGGRVLGTDKAVMDNKVTITSGTITGNVVGGLSWSGEASGNIVEYSGETTSASGLIGGGSNLGTVHDNKVTITSGTITGDVIGGKSGNNKDASNNIVNYAGGTIQGTIYGGKTTGTGISTGNTLNVRGKDLSAANIADFQKINFYIPDAAVSGDRMLELTGNAATALDNMKVNVGVVGGSNTYPGYKIKLLEKTGGGTITDTGTTYGNLTEGVSLTYKLTMNKSADNKILWATIPVNEEPVVNPGTKSIVETQALGSALIDSGQDQLAEEGIKNAVQAADRDGRYRYTPFAVIGGESMRYHTGSYIDSKGWNVGVGLSRVVNNAEGRLTFGPVISYGHSSYDSYLDDGLHADGSAHYTGLAFLLRQDDKDGFYYEGSFGGGQLKSDYNSSDLATSYDDSANYYAFHVALGKVQKLSSSASLDYYGKYFYSHQCASSATLATGENYHFDSIDSNRVRIGARVENAYSDRASLYYGAAWEYEFGGDARATYKGYDAPSPSLKGGSGLAEVGWKVKPYKDSPFSADLSLTGWAGKKEGFSLGAMLNWEI